MGKRCFDLLLTIPGLIILTPIFILIAICIKLDSPGPVIFKQERVGKGGKRFMIYKFRTMVNNAEQIGPLITTSIDRRITRTGGFLRKYKLDELPQLFNVLKGEMSLVGPRPEVPHYVNMYTETEMAALKLKPGITDPASIKYRNENELLAIYKKRYPNLDQEKIYIEKIMPEKININLEYAQRASVLRDLIIIINTLINLINQRRNIEI